MDFTFCFRMAPLPSAWLMEVARGIVSEDGAGLVGLFENAVKNKDKFANCFLVFFCLIH